MKNKSLSSGAAAHSILLVDDSGEIRQRLHRILSESAKGMDVLEAGTVSEAIAQIDARKPPTMMLDLGLPDGNGLEVLEHAKKVDASCVVVVLSNYAEPEMRQRCLERGADYVFSKSGEFEHAIAAVHRVTKRPHPGLPVRARSRRVHRARLKVMGQYGLHVRPAAQLVKLAQEFEAEIEIACNGHKANAKSILSVLILGAEHGAKVEVQARGRDAARAITAIKGLFAGDLYRLQEPASAVRAAAVAGLA